MKAAKLFFVTLLFFNFNCSDKPYKKVISTHEAPATIGPYSQAIETGNIIYVSGQIALVPETGKLVDGGIEEQTHQVIKNIEKILASADYNLADVIQCQVYLADLNDYQKMNEVYSEYFKENPPARAVVEASRIPKDALIEIMVTASKEME